MAKFFQEPSRTFAEYLLIPDDSYLTLFLRWLK